MLSDPSLQTKKNVITLHKILEFDQISWCGNFLETVRHSFCRVLGESPETLQKLCLSTKFPHQEIGLNFGILRSVRDFIANKNI